MCAEYALILVELNGKDLLREILVAYSDNEGITKPGRAAMECIEGAEALTRVRHSPTWIALFDCLSCFGCRSPVVAQMFEGISTRSAVVRCCAQMADRKTVAVRVEDPIVKWRHMLAAGQVMSVRDCERARVTVLCIK